MEKYTFCKVYEYEDRQILVQKEYNGDNETYFTKVTTSNGELLTSLSYGFATEEGCIECFDAFTKEKALEILKEKKEQIGKDFAELERVVMLKVVDDKWMEHLDNMEDLRNGIGLRGYAQKDPVVQYRIEGTYMFEEMITEIKLEITKLMMHVYKDEHAERTQSVEITGELVGQGVHIDKEPPKPKTEKGTPVVNKEIKVGRNEKCPCGSGKKYKNCCGK